MLTSFWFFYSSVSVFLFGALSLVVPSGYSVGAALLLLGGFFSLSGFKKIDFDKSDLYIVGVLLFYFCVNAIEVWWDTQGSSGLDKPSRFLFSVIALAFLLRYPPKAIFLWLGVCAGALLSGSWAVWQKLIDGAYRAEGYTHVIQFGNLNMLLGILCLAGLGWAYAQPRRYWWVALLGAGAVMGMLGSLASGSRGGWVGLPFVFLVLYRAYAYHWSKRWLLGMFILGVLSAGIVCSVPQLGVQGRVDKALSDIERFVENDNVQTSIGARFAMWEAAIELIPKKPVFGWGDNGYAEARDALVEEGKAASIIKGYGHVHNEYLDAWVKNGLVGLVALLAMYLVPMRLFSRYMHDHDLAVRSLSVAGVLLPVAYMDYGVSQVFLIHNSGVMMYAFFVVILWATLKNEGKLMQRI